MERKWLEEQNLARIHGWDFSHLKGRWKEGEDLPWDYAAVIGTYLKPEHRLLDLDTGGGEFLLKLGHPFRQTAATEGYEPNVAVCRETLLPMGIDFRAANAEEELPFEGESFDVVINRHGSFSPEELFRVLKPGGFFITQQVGEENDRELVRLLLPQAEKPFPGWSLAPVAEQLQNVGFEILRGEEAFRPIKFYDVGALVWFARIIEWEFPDFRVESCLPELHRAQSLLETQGYLGGNTHRFLIAAQKKKDA